MCNVDNIVPKWFRTNIDERESLMVLPWSAGTLTLHSKFGICLCIQWVLEDRDASDDVYALIVKFLNEFLHVRHDTTGATKILYTFRTRKRNRSREIFNIDNDCIELGVCDEIHELVAKRIARCRTLAHVHRTYMRGYRQMFDCRRTLCNNFWNWTICIPRVDAGAFTKYRCSEHNEHRKRGDDTDTECQ